jgi:putative ABC transport system permease protein
MSGSTDNFISAEGRKTPDEARPSTDYDFVSGSYFRVLGMSLVQGRLFSERDSSVGASRTAILDVSLARALFPGENPIARRVRFLGQTWEVAGVVGDVLHHGPDRGASNHIYLPQAASFIPGGSLVVRTKVPPLSLGESIRAAIFAVSPDQPVSNLRTLDQVVAGYIVERRLVLGLLGLFAALALGMAAIGLYGVMAFSVNQREHEIGIRSALGAPRGAILRMVLTSGIKLTMVGVAIGLLGAIAVSRVLSGFLVGVAPNDPVTLLAVALLLAGVALLACWLPAHRAARIDPMTALRSE